MTGCTFDRIFNSGSAPRGSPLDGRSPRSCPGSSIAGDSNTKSQMCWRPSANGSPPGSPASKLRSGAPGGMSSRRSLPAQRSFCWQADVGAAPDTGRGSPSAGPCARRGSPSGSPRNSPGGSPFSNRSPRTSVGGGNGGDKTVEALSRAMAGQRRQCSPTPGTIGGYRAREEFDIDYHPGARRVFSEARQSNNILRAGSPGARDEIDNTNHGALAHVTRAVNGVPMHCKPAARRGNGGLGTAAPAFVESPPEAHEALVMASGFKIGGGPCWPIEKVPRRHSPARQPASTGSVVPTSPQTNGRSPTGRSPVRTSPRNSISNMSSLGMPSSGDAASDPISPARRNSPTGADDTKFNRRQMASHSANTATASRWK